MAGGLPFGQWAKKIVEGHNEKMEEMEALKRHKKRGTQSALRRMELTDEQKEMLRKKIEEGRVGR